VEERLRPIFRCDDPALWQLIADAYHDCVLGKLRDPEPPFRHPWLVPGGGYVGQWLWDTTFVVDLLSILPEQEETIRGIFQNYWDFQQRWDAAQPDYAHGMIANFIAPYSGPAERDGKTWRTFPAYSQAPLLAWGMERVFLRNHDMDLVRAGVAPLEAFHEWYWRERDVSNIGLIGVGSYSGVVQEARYETYDNEVDLDGLKLLPYPGRKNSGPWYGDLCIPANTAYLLLSEASLARLAEAAGDVAMAKRRRARLAFGAAAMRSHMWDHNHGCFLAVNRTTMQKVQTATVGGFMALMAKVPTKMQGQRMAEVLKSPSWATPLPVPTVDRHDARFVNDGFWRGDVWPAPNYQVATGLAAYGENALAARIADATIDNAIRVGISEHYDSLTGKPLGVSGLGMSAVVITMALDGLSRKHQVAINPSNS
jgi:hypothetical protein